MAKARAILEIVTDASGVQPGIDKAEKSMLSLTGIAGKLGGLMAGAFAVTEIVSAAAEVVNFAGELTDLSAKTGIGTTALQELKYAGSQVGVELDQITRGVNDMQKRIAGGDASAVGAIKALGLNFDDLRAMKPEDQFRTLAERIADVEDPADRVKVAMDLFGKSGAEMLPLLTDEFIGLTEKANTLGIVMDEETVASMDTLGDTVGDLMDVGTALLARVLTPFVPLLTALAQGAMWVADALGDGLGWAIDKVGEGLAWLGRQIVGLLRSYVQMQQGIADMMPWLSEKLGITEGLAKADEWLASAEQALSGQQKETTKTTEQASAATRKLNLDYAGTKKEADAAAKAQNAYAKELQSLADQLTGKKIAEEIQKYADALKLVEQQGGISVAQSGELAKKLEELRQKAGGLPPELQAIADRAAFMARTFKDTASSVSSFVGAVSGVSIFPWDRPTSPFSQTSSVDGWDAAVFESDRQQRQADLWRNFGMDASVSWSMGFDDGIATNPIDAINDEFHRETIRQAREEGSKGASGFTSALASGLEALPGVIVGALQGGGNVLQAAFASMGASVSGWLTESIKKNMGTGLGASLLSGLAGTAVTVGAQLVGKLFSGNDTKKDREAAAKMFGFSSLDALYRELRALGEDKLVHEALNVIGKKDTAANQAWIQSVESVLAKKKELGDAFGAPEGALGFPTKAQLDKSASDAKAAYEYMKSSGLYTADVLQQAWQKWQDAAVAAGDQSVMALQGMKAELDKLNSEYDTVFGSIKEELENPEYDEAGNRVYGVIEAQGIARMEALEAERVALKEKMEAEQAESEQRMKESAAKVIDTATVVREGIEELFRNPIAVTFDWSGFPSTAAAAGASGRATFGGAMASGGFRHVTRPTWFLAGERPGGEDVMFSGIGKRFAPASPGRGFTGDVVVQVDGYEIARAAVRHQAEAWENAGF